MSRYAKTIIGAILALATWGITASSDGVYQQAELWGGLAAVATAVGVYLFPNQPPAGEPADPGISEQDPGRERDAHGRFV